MYPAHIGIWSMEPHGGLTKYEYSLDSPWYRKVVQLCTNWLKIGIHLKMYLLRTILVFCWAKLTDTDLRRWFTLTLGSRGSYARICWHKKLYCRLLFLLVCVPVGIWEGRIGCHGLWEEEKREDRGGDAVHKGERVCLCLCRSPRGDCGIAEVNESDWLVGVFLLALQVCTLAELHFFISPSLAAAWRTARQTKRAFRFEAASLMQKDLATFL